MASTTQRTIYIEACTICHKPIHHLGCQHRRVVGRSKAERISRQAYGPAGRSCSTTRRPLELWRHWDYFSKHDESLVVKPVHNALHQTGVRVRKCVVFGTQNLRVPDLDAVGRSKNDGFPAG